MSPRYREQTKVCRRGGIVLQDIFIIRRHITLWLGYLESGKFSKLQDNAAY